MIQLRFAERMKCSVKTIAVKSRGISQLSPYLA